MADGVTSVRRRQDVSFVPAGSRFICSYRTWFHLFLPDVVSFVPA